MSNLHKNSIFENRKIAYDSFRSFSHDPNQKGETLSHVWPARLAATKSLMTKRAFITRKAFDPNSKIIANSLMIPNELIWASGYLPFNWEMFSSLIASHSQIINVTNDGSVPVPRCSFINSLKGSFLRKILPMPNAVLSSSAYCEGIGHVMSEVANGFEVPHYHIDIPGYYSNYAVTSLAGQLKDIFSEMCFYNEISIQEGEKKLIESHRYSTIAKRYYQEMQDIRKQYAPLNLGLEPLHWHGQFAPFWGDESGVELCRKLRDEIHTLAISQSSQEKKGLPVAMFGLIPYGRTEVWRQLYEADVNICFEGVNYMGEIVLPSDQELDKMDVQGVFENLAINMLYASVRGLDYQHKSELFIKNAADSGCKGMIIFSHEHCQMLPPRLNEYENNATKYGIKFVSISGDCILGMPKGPTGLRLGTFLSELKSGDNVKTTNTKQKTEKTNRSIADVRVGVDFGSGFSKYVAIDKNNKLIHQGLYTSGIDYPHLLKEIMMELKQYDSIEYALAGVGGDNPELQTIVNHQTTEISSLIRASRELYKDLKSFIVIDIGTQDVKILRFAEDEKTPWINTNKSCGAGTGMVLVQILERWKQSNPKISFQDIDQMALNANKVEMINTTCGIFAVTNVVSALIQSNDEQKRDILKGVYHYIASQAIKLLPPNFSFADPLLLVGGVGSHKSLQKIFKEKGFALLTLPDDIQHQHIIAYGTALALAEEVEVEMELNVIN